jgi:hypothetical protein
MFHTKYQGNSPSGFLTRRFLKTKSFGCHYNHSFSGNPITLLTMVELQVRNIPAKFQQIWRSRLEGEAI